MTATFPVIQGVKWSMAAKRLILSGYTTRQLRLRVRIYDIRYHYDTIKISHLSAYQSLISSHMSR
jgi:hypothetical protein